MKSPPRWLSADAILAIHQRILFEFGGADGLRDLGLLQSALSRAEHLWRYQEPDLFDLAAVCAGGIVRNHPFVDGNKRVTFTVAFTFLGINGYDVQAPEPEVVVMTVGLAEKSVKETEYAAWLRANALPP